MCHDHTFPAAQDELFSILACDFCIEGLSKGESDEGASRRGRKGWVGVFGEARGQEFWWAIRICHSSAMAGKWNVRECAAIREMIIGPTCQNKMT